MIPTDEQRRNVRYWGGLGLLQEQIATLMNISVDTLQKYFKEDIVVGKAEKAVTISNAFHQKCLEGDAACLIFFMKTQLRWRDVSTVEHSLKGSEKVRDVVRDLYGISLSDEPTPAETRRAVKAIEKRGAEDVRH